VKSQGCFVSPTIHDFGSVRWVWDNLLEPGTVIPDWNGVWHIGKGTDLKELEEKLNELAAKKEEA